MKKKTEEEWIDIHDDALMVSLGLRQPKLIPRDPSVWTKSKKEKEFIKKMKHSISQQFVNTWGGKKDIVNFKGKLNVTIKKNDSFTMYDSTLKRRIPKTTFSFNCYEYYIPFILQRFKISKTEDLVIKVTFNGKPYTSTKLS